MAKWTPGGTVLCHYQKIHPTTCGHGSLKGQALSGLLLVQDPKGPRTTHLLHSRATFKPAAGLRTPS